MIKLVGLFKAKPGMTRDAFVEHYEEVHAPLLLRMMPQIRKFTRNYINVENFTPGHGQADHGSTPDFDVITELWFDDMEALQQVKQITADPHAGKIISDDEERFIDRSCVKILIVEERSSQIKTSNI